MADSSTDIFDILHTTRAMRRLKPDRCLTNWSARSLRLGFAAANGAIARPGAFWC